MDDHSAHVETWLWHLAGWSLDNQFHVSPDAPTSKGSHGASFQALKECLLKPREITTDEIIGFISRPIYMGRPRPASEFELTPQKILENCEANGWPVDDAFRALVRRDNATRDARVSERVAAGGRRPGAGRPSKRTQYEDAYDRRKGLYHKFVRLPKAGADARRSLGQRTSSMINDVATRLETVGIKPTADHILDALQADGQSLPDPSTVRRALRRRAK